MLEFFPCSGVLEYLKKKVPLAAGLQLSIYSNILQQPRSSFKKEVKIETVIKILFGHST